jgi:hypothetical protein
MHVPFDRAVTPRADGMLGMFKPLGPRSELTAANDSEELPAKMGEGSNLGRDTIEFLQGMPFPRAFLSGSSRSYVEARCAYVCPRH